MEERKTLRCKMCHRELVLIRQTPAREHRDHQVACKNPECEDYGRVVTIESGEDGPAAQQTA